MRLAAFVIVMLAAAGGVGVWSYMNGATSGTIMLRVVITIIALQVVYFLLLVLAGLLPKSKTPAALNHGMNRSDSSKVVARGSSKISTQTTK
jgi:exopolysaccharide production repressor protein